METEEFEEIDVIIGEGELTGKGVYANRNFKADEVVILYHLIPLTDEEFNGLTHEKKIFTHSYKGQIFLYSEPERYVNHSDDPNTVQDLDNKADVALRDIQKGEMITTDATKDDTD